MVPTASASSHVALRWRRVGAGRGRAEVLGAEQEPEPEREQHERGDDLEAALPGEHLDAEDRADDHAGERAGDEQAGHWAAEAFLACEPQQTARGRGDVEQQVGRGDRRAGDVKHAQLDREQ